MFEFHSKKKHIICKFVLLFMTTFKTPQKKIRTQQFSYIKQNKGRHGLILRCNSNKRLSGRSAQTDGTTAPGPRGYSCYKVNSLMERDCFEKKNVNLAENSNIK